MSDHGRIIPLTPEPYEPERHIEVYAGSAADLDEPTLALEVARRLGSIQQRGSGPGCQGPPEVSKYFWQVSKSSGWSSATTMTKRVCGESRSF